MLHQQLEKAGVLSGCFEKFHDRTRDSDEIKVLKDKKTGVLYLSSTAQVQTFQENIKEVGSYTVNGSKLVTPKVNDTERRYINYFLGEHYNCWLDFGCGEGDLLRRVGQEVNSKYGVDNNKSRLERIREYGINSYKDMTGFENDSLDLITLFHVFEHIDTPLDVLEGIRSKLKPGGTVIIEVPHSNDALISLYSNNKFRDFSFWSEHLVLYNEESLKNLVTYSGFKIKNTEYVQRYPISNHLYWLSNEKPGGHDIWAFLDSAELHKQWEKSLAANKLTDTIVVHLTK